MLAANFMVLPQVPVYAGPGTVIERLVIGHSVRGRPIIAWHLGQPGRPKAVVFAAMHGDETAPRQILFALVDGAPVHGVDLWVVPTYNPDGVARGTRKNAHGVDLNRNFPYSWRDLDGAYESGPGPASEPETKAVIGFLRRVRPHWIVSFHQPLRGVDRDTKWPAFARRLAHNLELPLKDFDCGGVCHGTMTGWYNHRFAGGAVTVEYGAHPGRHRMRVTAPRQLLRALGGWR
ncbi:MAG TPA: M14 family zinc carboxypeptidase [Nocardioides sp.]|jgi:protein MpaA